MGCPLRRIGFGSSSRTVSGRPGTLPGSRLRVPVGVPSPTVPVRIVGSTRPAFRVAVGRFRTRATRRSEGLSASGSVVGTRPVVPGAWPPGLPGCASRRCRSVVVRGSDPRRGSSVAVSGTSADPRLFGNAFLQLRWSPVGPFCSTPDRSSSLDATSFGLRLDAGWCSAPGAQGPGSAPLSAVPLGTRPGPGCGEARPSTAVWETRRLDRVLARPPRVFHAAGTIHRLCGIADRPGVHEVDRRPRGAGAGGDFRRDRSVR